jgi:hypothetical protein
MKTDKTKKLWKKKTYTRTVDMNDQEFRKLYRKAKNKGLKSHKGGGVS